MRLLSLLPHIARYSKISITTRTGVVAKKENTDFIPKPPKNCTRIFNPGYYLLISFGLVNCFAKYAIFLCMGECHARTNVSEYLDSKGNYDLIIYYGQIT